MRTRRALVAAGAVVALLVSVSSPASPAGVDSSKLSATADRAFSEISRCMNGEGSSLNVLYLLDSSSSLQDTDPTDLRKDIVSQSIEQLGHVAEGRPVSVAISTFDLSYENRLDWKELTPASAGKVADWANQNVGGWDTGGGTNWEAALGGAQRTMTESPDSRSACKAVVWLTDGGINVTGDTSDTGANITAMEGICGANPVTGISTGGASIVQSMRTSNVHLLGVLLRNDRYLATLEPDVRAFELSRMGYMLPISEGSGSVNDLGFTLSPPGNDLTYGCGEVPVPDNVAAGALLIGQDPITVAFQFSSLANRIQGGSPIGVTDGDPLTFQIEKGINGFDIQLASKNWSLSDPSGQAVARADDGGMVDGATVASAGLLTTVRVRGTAVQDGLWSLKYSKGPRPNVFVYSLVTLAMPVPELFAGAGSPVMVTAKLPDSQPADLSVYGTADFTLSAATGGKRAEPVGDCTVDEPIGTLTCEYTPAEVGAVTFDGRLDLATMSGTAFPPVAVRVEASIQPPPQFPHVSPETLPLSALDGRHGAATGTMTLVGPTKGDGQVCFPPAADVVITKDPLPARDASYVFTGPEWGQCVSTPEGQTESVTLTIRNPEAASGSVSGSIPVVLKSASSSLEVQQSVAFEFETVRQGSPPWWILATLIFLGIAIPVALLYLQAFWVARLHLKELQSVLVPIVLTFTPDTVTLARAGGTVPTTGLFELDEWKFVNTPGDRVRSFAAPGGVTLVGRMPRNPLGAIVGIARPPDASRVVSSEGGTHDGRWATIGLRPSRQWIVIVPESALLADGDDVAGHLLAFVDRSAGSLEEQGSELATEANMYEAHAPWLPIRQAVKTTTGQPTDRAPDPARGTSPRNPPDPDPDPFGKPDQPAKRPVDPFAEIGPPSDSATPPPKDPFRGVSRDAPRATPNPSPPPGDDPFADL